MGGGDGDFGGDGITVTKMERRLSMKHGWEYKKLGEICQIVTGSTPKTSVQEYWGGKYPWVTPAELKGDVFIDDTERHITDEAVAHTNVTLLPIGTVLLSSRAPIGKVAITTREMYCNQGFKNLICSDTIFNKYLYFWLKGKTDYLNSLGRGATFKEISKSIVENIQIPLPPIQSQQSIVSELDKINELICLKKEQLKDYDNLAQSIFYEMFGDPVNNEKGWNVKKLGDVCEVSSFKRVLVEDVLEKGPVPFIRGTELSAICKENKREYKMYITMEHYERVKNISGVPNVGDLLIPSINAEGLVWVVDTPEPMYYKDGRVLWVHVDQNSISPIALQRILNNLIKDNYSKITNGAVFAELNLSILRSFPIILPPLSIQNAFANKINLIEKQKAEIKSTIADLETLLASRMQYWFD